MTFRERHHAVWRELLNCEPIHGEDEAILRVHLLNVQGDLPETRQTVDALSTALSYLEERAMAMSIMTPDQRQKTDAYRRQRAERQGRDSWQQKAPRTVTKAEHDALLDVEVGTTKPVDREEYERMMREAQE